MIARSVFLHGAAAATIATGGLDVWERDAAQIRVLVASDVRGAAPLVFGDGTFGFGGRRWRGAPSTVGMPDGRLALVTTIDVDLYLQGVVPLESPPSWPPAALEAQAIVARTFALGRRSLSRPYDVVAGDSDQRWGGVDAEAPAATAAVQATRGMTLAFGNGPASVFYSACCGGRTADIATVWGGAPLPYLRGVDDPYCAPAPDYRWSRAVPLARALALFGTRTGGTLASATLGEPDPGGRPRVVILGGTAIASIPVPEFRRALGSETVRSLWLRALRLESQEGAGRLAIDGAGRGHGVGLCQWGARYFAAAGASAETILSWYFPGSSVARG